MQGRWFSRGDLLGAQVLLHRHRVVGAALDRGVVGDDHALAPRDPADAGDDAGAGDLAAVHPPGGELGELQEGRAEIEQLADPLARQELAPLRCASRGPSRRRPALIGAAFSRRSATRALISSALRGTRQTRMALQWSCRVLSWELQAGLIVRALLLAAFAHLRSAVSLNSSRPISIRRISLVPAPIS